MQLPITKQKTNLQAFLLTLLLMSIQLAGSFLIGCGFAESKSEASVLFWVGAPITLLATLALIVLAPILWRQSHATVVFKQNFYARHRFIIALLLSCIFDFGVFQIVSSLVPESAVATSGWGSLCAVFVAVALDSLLFFTGTPKETVSPKHEDERTQIQRRYQEVSPFFLVLYFLLILAPYVFAKVPELDAFFTSGTTKIIFRGITTAIYLGYAIAGSIIFRKPLNLKWTAPFILLILCYGLAWLFNSKEFVHFFLDAPGSVVIATEVSSAQSISLTFFLLCAESAVFLVSASWLPYSIGSRKTIIAFFSALLLLALAASIYSLFAEAEAYAESFSGHGVKTISSFFHHKNEFGAFLFLGCLACSFLSIYLHHWTKYLTRIAFVFLLVISAFVKCFTAFVPILVLGIILLVVDLSYLRKRNKWSFWLSLAVLFVVIVSLVLMTYIEPVRQNVKLFASIYNVVQQTEAEIISRTKIWNLVYRVVVGPSVFIGKTDAIASTELMAITLKNGDFHSSFVSFYAAHGIAGLFVYLVLIIYAYRESLSIYRADKRLSILLVGILSASVLLSMPESYTLFINASSIALPTLLLFYVFLPFIKAEAVGPMSCKEDSNNIDACAPTIKSDIVSDMDKRPICCSVVMLTYNSEVFLRPQLDSILENISSEDEIVISDDGSTDSTLDILNDYAQKDSRIHIYRNLGAHGPNGNWNNAYSKCRGKFVFHSDDDNVWMPNKIERTLTYFQSNPSVAMIMHDARIVDKDLNELHPSFFSWRNSKPGVIHNVIKLSYGGSMMAFRSEMLGRLLPMPEDAPFFFDAWVGFMADKHYKSLFVPDVLSLWRRHEGTASGGTFTDQQDKAPSKKQKRENRLLSRLKILFFVLRH